jgi:OOP family OmpA-OmpF porin
MKLRTLYTASALMSLPAIAMAQPIGGIYVSLGAGLNLMENITQAFSFQQFHGNGPDANAAGPFPTTHRAGYAISGAVGYGFGKGLRLELEGSYRSNPMNTSNVFGNLLTYRGDDQKTSVIASINYDIDVGLPIYPYVGAGAGVALNRWAHVVRTATNLTQPTLAGQIIPTSITGVSTHDGSQAVLALQFTAGAAYPIESVPGLSLTLDYKYFAMPNQRTFSESVTFSCPGGGTTCGAGVGRPTLPATGSGYGTYNAEYNHSIMVGVRYAFGGPARKSPPAAAAPAPVAAAARSYLVFFDWDKSILTDRARSIVADAAQTSAKVQTTRIEVNGNADTSGTPAYNQGLAMRRAQSVAAELVKNGVKKEQIAILSFGDTHLLVPTGPGVREPQNRRVEIILK